MKVVFSEAALADLEAIGDYIARDNPRRAVSFVDELVACAERIADAPEGFPLIERDRRRGIRKRVHKSYLIFYRVRGDEIEILHVLNGAQDWDAMALAAD
ncbi:type II toxin-antitoxin system RelE/ParE family toxin [Methylorubrum sp. SB2]|uniref:type II toxin-antitoxin system RelE/ParE family toxin n=1 Tax=Methylorubrum subtropicum TaxID=3138812 RepID=UPI00313B5870